MATSEKMTCVSILICDEVYRDERTKKLVVVGTFNQFNAPQLPCKLPRMTVLFTLTNGRGSYDLKLSIEYETTGQAVVEIAGPFRIDDPLQIFDSNVYLIDVPFFDEGKYWVVLSADGEILGQRPFWVKKATQ